MGRGLMALGYGIDGGWGVGGADTAPPAPPTLSYASPQAWTYGAAITPVSPTTTGATSFAVQSGALPTGVSLNTSTGEITGTPTAWAESGSATIRATGAGGTADSVISWTMAFVPATFGTCVLWLKADGTLWQDSARTTAAVADGDPVGALDDGSGDGRNVTQGTGAARPTLKLAIQNGLPVIRFAVDDFLSYGSSVVGAQPISIASVQKYSTADAFEYVVDGAGANRVIHGKRGSGTAAAQLFAGSLLTGGVATSGLYKSQIGIANGASSVLRYAGAEVATGAGGSGHLGTSITVGVGASAIEFLNGDLCELLIYSTILDAGQIASIEAYFAAKWGL